MSYDKKLNIRVLVILNLLGSFKNCCILSRFLKPFNEFNKKKLSTHVRYSTSKRYIYIQCKLNLAIVLSDQVSSFIFYHEDTFADHLTIVP